MQHQTTQRFSYHLIFFFNLLSHVKKKKNNCRNYSTSIYKSVISNTNQLKHLYRPSLTYMYGQKTLRMKPKNNCILKDACVSFHHCLHHTVQNSLSPSPWKSCNAFRNSCQKRNKREKKKKEKTHTPQQQAGQLFLSWLNKQSYESSLGY